MAQQVYPLTIASALRPVPPPNHHPLSTDHLGPHPPTPCSSVSTGSGGSLLTSPTTCPLPSWLSPL